MSLICLSLGSNLNNRAANLREAIARLGRRLDITAVSPVYETEPWGDLDQPPFLNACIAATTTLEPRDVLHLAKSIEREMGRQPSHKWGPRLIDIDILFYDDLVMDEGDLIIPHPRIAERAFVLAPLADLAPDHRHPRTGDTVRQMLDRVDATGVAQLSNPTGLTQP